MDYVSVSHIGQIHTFKQMPKIFGGIASNRRTAYMKRGMTGIAVSYIFDNAISKIRYLKVDI